MTENSAQLHKLRLLVNRSTGEVIYAEADKTFVDFFFSLLMMPMGTVMELLSSVEKADTDVGCMINIYKSVKNMDTKYLQHSSQKDELLHPKLYGNTSADSLFKIKSSNAPTEVPYYGCGNSVSSGSHSISNVKSSRCNCGRSRDHKIDIVHEEADASASIPGNQQKNVVGVGAGYVKETVSFIVTDDLEMTPASTGFIIKLLNEHNVKDVSNLEQRWVVVGYTEAVKLLEAALVSKNALNDVFGSGRRIPLPNTSFKERSEAWDNVLQEHCCVADGPSAAPLPTLW